MVCVCVRARVRARVHACEACVRVQDTLEPRTCTRTNTTCMKSNLSMFDAGIRDTFEPRTCTRTNLKCMKFNMSMFDSGICEKKKKRPTKSDIDKHTPFTLQCGSTDRGHVAAVNKRQIL